MKYDTTIFCNSEEQRHKVLAYAQKILPFNESGNPEGWTFERAGSDNLVLKTENQPTAMLTPGFKILGVRVKPAA